MNILREIRKVKKRSMSIKIILLLTFCVMFIVTTYAWFSNQKDVKLGGLQGDVTSWDVSYYVNSDTKETLDQTAVFTIEQLYPGMSQREEFIHIYNIGQASTDINYELVSVKVFGQEVIDQIDIGVDGNTRYVFSGDTDYPFTVSYTYDKDYLKGKYVDNITTPNAKATFKFTVNWKYEGQSLDETENIAKDVLDTNFGKDAYEYYSDAANDPSKAIEIKVKITSSMIHPSLES